MMKHLINASFGLLALLLVSGHSAATEATAPRQFNIELLIFQNLIENDGGEVWPADYSNWFENATETPAPTNEPPPQVTWLSPEHFHLNAERNSLGRSSRYRPLAYLAWRQAVHDRSRARPLTLPAPESIDKSYVDGTVKVAVERYLHLYLDLQLHLPGDNTVRFGADDLKLPEIRLTEKRRMRSREIHYFDNPRFGLIAFITPYEPPATATDSDGAQTPTPP